MMVVKATEFRDVDQNSYYISVNGYCFIELSCYIKRKVRKIAKISGDEIIKKENGLGIHRKTMSFDFLYKLLKQAQLGGTKRVVIIFNGSVFMIDLENFFSKGFVLFFKESGKENLLIHDRI
ncbi:hypothetical protein [Desulfurobacterium sp.]